ncbi:MAG TPA: hypothetical protein VK986_19135, partial [Tepidisphaeraceae bacterium]|nr:hypothetical protein [Tepidisphaeraceae bacterium]
VGRWISCRSRALAVATAVGVGMGALGVAALGLSLAGGLNRWTAIGLLLTGPALSVRRLTRWARIARDVRAADVLAKPAGGHWVLLAAAPAIGMMLFGAAIVPGTLWRPEDPHPYDALEYHLQAPREWYEAGRMTPLRHNVFSYFPYGVEMHSLMAMHARGGAWAAMYHCQYFSVAWVLLAGLAVYGGVREAGAGRAVASAGAAMTVSLPWMVMLGTVAFTEGALAFYAALAVAWALRAVRSEEGRTRAMAVAGVLAGLACGVKYTAVPMVVIGLLIAVGIAALTSVIAAGGSRRSLGIEWARSLTVFGFLAVLVASPWLIRNWAWTGNPVFPLAMNQLGRGHFDNVQVERFRIAHSPTEADRPIGARVMRAGREIVGGWQYAYVFWPVVVGAGVVGLLTRRPREVPEAGSAARRAPQAGRLQEEPGAAPRSEAATILLFLICALMVWIGFTHLLARFYVLCIPVAALAVAYVRWRHWPIVASSAAISVALVSWCPLPGAEFDGVSGRVDSTGAPAMLHARLASYGTEKWREVIGLDRPLLPEPLWDVGKSDDTVWLIGDAQAFLYAAPPGRLRYRTVFDLPGGAAGMYEAWLGVPPSQVRGTVILHPAEVERLSRTYYKVPGLPPDMKARLQAAHGAMWEMPVVERR